MLRKRQWQPIPVLLPGKSQSCSPRGREESDTTEWLHFHFSLSCIGEGNGNPLQCSCLESPSDGGAWWAAVYGVAQSRTRPKRLSSSSSSSSIRSTSLDFAVIYHLVEHFHTEWSFYCTGENSCTFKFPPVGINTPHKSLSNYVSQYLVFINSIYSDVWIKEETVHKN